MDRPRVYLAGRFEFGCVHFPGLHAYLEQGGVTVTSTWYLEQSEKADETLTQAQRLVYAKRDLSQIDDATMFVMFNLAPEYVYDRTCGRHTELGYAIARRCSEQLDSIILIGEIRSVFHGYVDGHLKSYDPQALLMVIREQRDYANLRKV